MDDVMCHSKQNEMQMADLKGWMTATYCQVQRAERLRAAVVRQRWGAGPQADQQPAAARGARR